ncbi:sodium:calcium antiporter [Marinisporobacter balticus]|uniref:Cation:H+ antiporter n=1 Tax=Marinisporobacter balticus TaxID=2018667 RepID=A0A4R2L5H7_9FIRM|nr:sodium:calcium antiporter [Marinisporobacter balticus]TCO74415.1 cation:H+ antiporter [Marinisporobacter balticus]
MFDWISNIWIAIVMLFAMAWVINVASDKLGDVLHVLGLKLNIPNSVRGATFDAIASSFPEFSTAMVAVVVYKEFADVGVPTIAGSGIFNILLIPMLAIFAYHGTDKLKADPSGVYRDMVFYTISILTLIITAYFGKFTPVSGVILICIYVGYIVTLYLQTKKYQQSRTLGEQIADTADLKHELDEEGEDEDFVDMPYSKIFGVIIITMGLLWISCDAIVKSAIVISDTFGISKLIVSVVILAACTSIPDTLLSIKSAKLGDADGAVSNAVGSNIFDICICLGFPMLIAGKEIPVNFGENIIIFAFLLLSMLTTATLLLKKDGIGKKDAPIMAIVYGLFILYVIGVAVGFIPLNLLA